MKILTYEMCLQYINLRNKIEVHEDSAEYYYDEKLDNAHDKIFRDLLSDEEEAVKFINKFLKSQKKLKSGDIEKYSNSYITKEYKNRESDIVYKIKNTNTFILIEHQSYVDALMPYRMLEYSVEIMRSAMNQEKAKSSKYKCPEVVLIVLYTGNEKWNAEKEYKKISDNEFYYGTAVTNSIYNLVDIHDYKIEELVNGESMVEKAMAIEKCKTEEELIETLEGVIGATKEEKDKEKIRRIIQYILRPIIGQEETQILLNKLKKEENTMAGMLMTNLMEERRKLIEESEKRGEKRGEERGEKRGIKLGEERGEKRGIKLGEERGERRGRLEGSREGIIYVAKEMLKEQIEIDKIAKVTKLKEEEIEKLKAELASA